MKQCKVCNLLLSDTRFRQNRNKCKKCGRLYRSERGKELIKKLKFEYGNICKICRCTDSRVLIWHHATQGGKEYSIGQIVAWGRLNKIRTEISKCILICANCHAILHHEEGL